jgi:hypothetical protein
MTSACLFARSKCRMQIASLENNRTMNTPTPREKFEQWLETVKYDNSDILSPSNLAWEAWQAAIQKEQDEYCPLSDPNHPHGIRFREDSPTPINPTEP